LCFVGLVLLIPVNSGSGLIFRFAVVLAPLLLMWVFYFAGRTAPWAMTALFLAILVLSGLSIRNRALGDTSLDPQNLIKLAVWGSGLLVALLNWRHLRMAWREPVLRWLVAMSLWASFTAIYSPIRAYSFGSGIAFLSVLLFGACLRRVVPDSLLLKGSIGALTPLLYVSLAMYVLVPERAMALMEAGNILRLAAPFASPNSLGLVAAIVVLLGAVGWRTALFTWHSPWILVSVPAALACMFLSQSRTAGVGLAVSVLVLLLLRHPLRMLVTAIFIALGALAFVVFDVNLQDLAAIVSRTGSVKEVTTLTGRTQIWSFVWGEIIKEPWFGYGSASTKHLMPLNFHTFWGWTTTHAHNMWLQVWFTTGLVGVSLLAGALIAQFRYWLATRDTASLAFLVFVFVIGLAEAAHIDGAPSVLTAVWFAWLIKPRPESASVCKRHVMSRVGVVAVPSP
jgi:O-antigen ligase